MCAIIHKFSFEKRKLLEVSNFTSSNPVFLAIIPGEWGHGLGCLAEPISSPLIAHVRHYSINV
jgi:hypothetical protein